MHLPTIIISIGWIIFWLYWIISALGSKKEAHSDIRQSVGARIAIFPLAAALVLLLNHLPYSLKNHYQALNNNHVVLALGLIAFWLGLFIAVWARLCLGNNWGMPMAQIQNPELVTSGPYHYIRHPIYTGILLMALGSFFDVNMYWLVVFAAATVFFIYSATAEERLMIKQFPKAYPSYKRRTKMLIPFVS